MAEKPIDMDESETSKPEVKEVDPLFQFWQDQVTWALNVAKDPESDAKDRKLANEIIRSAQKDGYFIKLSSHSSKKRSIIGDLRRATEAEQEEL